MRRLKNTKILAGLLSVALIFSNAGVCTFADPDPEETDAEVDSNDGGPENAAIDSSDSGSHDAEGSNGSADSSGSHDAEGSNGSADSSGTHDDNGESNGSPDGESSSSSDSEDDSDDNASEESGNSGDSGDQIGDSPDDNHDVYDSPTAPGVGEITDDTEQSSGNDIAGSGSESFGEIVNGDEVTVDEEISEEFLATDTTKKSSSDDDTEEIPVSDEAADISYKVSVSDSVTVDELGNASFTFTVAGGSGPVRIDSVDLNLYPGDTDISYDSLSREMGTVENEGFSFRKEINEGLETGEEKSFTATIPFDTEDMGGSGETLSEVLSLGDTQISASVEATVFDSEDYHELGQESRTYYIGSYSKPEEEGSDEDGEEPEELHADYRIRTVKYDGDPHEMAFPRKVMEGRKVLYSTDSIEWTEVPFSYTEAGEYECYYKMIEESTGDVCRSGSLTMKIRNRSVRTGDEDEDEEEDDSVNTGETGSSGDTLDTDRTELPEMFKEMGDAEVMDHSSKLESYLDAEGVNNLSGSVSKAFESEISRSSRDSSSFPAVWVWMMVFFMFISFGIFSVTNNIWTGLYKAFVRACAYFIVFFRKMKRA